jgi:hypothetical protein
MSTDLAHEVVPISPDREDASVEPPRQPRHHRPVRIGEAITSIGAPSLDAWSSCLSPADLQTALLAAA